MQQIEADLELLLQVGKGVADAGGRDLTWRQYLPSSNFC
jgi:hypothetical protein